MSELFSTKKELAQRLKRSTRFVRFMELGGLCLPCTLEEAVSFIRKHRTPSKFRRK